jgi:hypothetical protein
MQLLVTVVLVVAGAVLLPVILHRVEMVETAVEAVLRTLLGLAVVLLVQVERPLF